MSELCVEVQGARVRVEGDPEAVEALSRHFPLQRGAVATPCEVSVTLRRGRRPVGDGRRLVAAQVLERGVVYSEGPVTWVDHHGHATSLFDFEREAGEITAPERNDLVELGYLMIHSRLGALLERRAFRRVHALGLELSGGAVLVLVPSGGGKSTLGLEALRSGSERLLGDDLVLVRDGAVFGFPSPPGLTSERAAEGLGRAVPFPRRHHPPKWILDLEGLAHRFAPGPLPLRWVVEARRASAAPSRFREVSRTLGASLLFRDLVVGLGLPQVLELVARRGARDLPALAPIALGRSWSAATLLAGARVGVLEAHRPEGALSLLREHCS